MHFRQKIFILRILITPLLSSNSSYMYFVQRAIYMMAKWYTRAPPTDRPSRVCTSSTAISRRWFSNFTQSENIILNYSNTRSMFSDRYVYLPSCWRWASVISYVYWKRHRGNARMIAGFRLTSTGDVTYGRSVVFSWYFDCLHQ